MIIMNQKLLMSNLVMTSVARVTRTMLSITSQMEIVSFSQDVSQRYIPFTSRKKINAFYDNFTEFFWSFPHRFHSFFHKLDHHVHSSDAQKTTTSVDSCRTFFPPMSSEFSLKFIRLAFARPAEFGPEKFFPITREPIVLNCKVFVPATIVSPTSQNVYDFRYEDLSSLKRKMSAWLQTTGLLIFPFLFVFFMFAFQTHTFKNSFRSFIHSKKVLTMERLLTTLLFSFSLVKV